MSRALLCWGVSLGQIALSITLWWYSPLEIREAQRAAHARFPGQGLQLGQDFFLRLTPTPAEKVSWSMNFPAAVLAGPFNLAFRKPLYEGDLRYLGVKDLAFFCWTGILWFWVTWVVVSKGKIKGGQKMAPPWSRILLSACGLAFSVFTGGIAVEAFLSRSPVVSYEQVAAFGLIWAAGLTAYFGRKLASDLRTRTRG